MKRAACVRCWRRRPARLLVQNVSSNGKAYLWNRQCLNEARCLVAFWKAVHRVERRYGLPRWGREPHRRQHARGTWMG